ncbi:MAG TPA: DLW-39 family protein [Microlunatus sp.]|nr:DLW-39 family protein [Microlunatus sp.]
MNWKFVAVMGAVVGGLAYVVGQRRRKAREDAALWAEATDPVNPAR